MSMPLSPFRPTEASRVRVAALRAQLSSNASSLCAAVVGAGKSGIAAYALLAAKGAKVRLLDDREESAIELPAHLEGASIGRITEAELSEVDLVVLSPGVPRARPELASAIARGVVVGEIELASWFVRAPLVGITGTNGKSTTTALLGHVLATAGIRAFVGGNLGRPLAELVTSEERVDVAVVELSSYQLESIVEARFEVACWLNLTPDHADRYANLELYAAAKARLLEARSASGVAVLNADDLRVADAGRAWGGAVRWFSVEGRGPVPEGTVLEGRDLAVRREAGVEERYDLASDALVGLHNRANMCAVIECARALEVDARALERGLATFRGLAHRIELIRTLDGVRFYNDSKATNVDSAVIALRAVEGPKILIVGGKDKGAPWSPLVELARADVRAVLAIGSASPIVERAFRGVAPIVETLGTLERAVARAAELARPGDAVLLSPACASFDQFKNYEHRGEVFRTLVVGLENAGKVPQA